MSVSGDGIRAPARRSATDLAYEVLKRQVLICEIGPGTELREADLATALGVSRTPVREALNRLVYDGFVEVRPRQGYRVTDVTLAAVHEVFELRSQLEPVVVTLAVERASAEQLALLREHAHAPRPTTFEDCITQDHQLHELLADLSGNRRMAKVMRQLLAEMQRVLFLSLSGRSEGGVLNHHHPQLWAAIEARDAVLAQELTVAEIEANRQRVLTALIERMPHVSLQSPHP